MSDARAFTTAHLMDEAEADRLTAPRPRLSSAEVHRIWGEIHPQLDALGIKGLPSSVITAPLFSPSNEDTYRAAVNVGLREGAWIESPSYDSLALFVAVPGVPGGIRQITAVHSVVIDQTKCRMLGYS